MPVDERGLPTLSDIAGFLMSNHDYADASAYPHPEDFEVMRPDFYEEDDGFIKAVINVSPFSVEGRSMTKPGARRAALYEAEKTYGNYHPSYRVRNPFPEAFVDQQGMTWRRIPAHQRSQFGDYRFKGEEDEEEDFADIEQMLMWDVRPVEILEKA